MRTRVSLLLLAVACAPAPTPPEAPGDSDTHSPTQLGSDQEKRGDSAPMVVAGDTDSWVRDCYPHFFESPAKSTPDYSRFGPRVPAHCKGTDHQDITQIQRVVFLGDSVAVGTPPTSTGDYFRNRLAARLADQFGLDAPGILWREVDPTSGTSWRRDSGDFSNCARWGARAKDLMANGSQVLDCLPEEERHKRTLVILNVGGNDLMHLINDLSDGRAVASLWEDTRLFMKHVREVVEWIKAPGRFPNGVDVITTNLIEFTDATGDTSACPAAAVSGIGAAEGDPDLEAMVVWAMEEFMSVVVDTQSDMLFLLEAFCGHGYRRDDPSGRCYLGPDSELWFDLSCTHPNPTGHGVIADMYMSVILE